MDLSQFHTVLFDWFKSNGRVLPWREKDNPKAQQKANSKPYGLTLRDHSLATYFTNAWHRDPYRVVISELMLQQTQVDRVLPKFKSFLKKWPTVNDLARAKLSEIMIEWQGLGYNRRARFLHEMAKIVMKDHKGVFPTTEQELLTLPGIGLYTARAMLAFAYGKDVGVVDTNIQRIFARLMLGCEPNDKHAQTKEFVVMIDSAVPKGKGDPWNQALMDFGALVCTGRSPKCETCVLQHMCKANFDAKKVGKAFYVELLLHQRKEKTFSTNSAKVKQPFHTTNRYFRGRIVDKLREGSTHMQLLRDYLTKNHSLTDKVRFGNIIEQLMKDKLITIRGSIVSLD
ncbi:MAG: A/G-specific adenine glycosylase [Patescibacteria group bacterium]